MSRPLCRLRSALVAATMLAPISAHAQDATAEQAAQLQDQLRGWLAALLGPKIPLGDKPIKVTPEGDHLRLSIDVAGPVASTPFTVTGGPFTVNAKHLDGGRWSIDDLRTPSPLRLDNARPGESGFKGIVARSEEQTSHGVLDTTLATPATFDSMTRGYTSTTEDTDGSSVTSVASSTTHTEVQPALDGRANVMSDTRAEKLAVATTQADGSRFKFTADRVSLGAHSDNVSFDQVGPMIRSVMALMPDAPSPARKPAEPVAAVPPAGKGKGNPQVAANAKQALAGALRPGGAKTPAVETAKSAPAKRDDMTPAQKVAAHQLLASLRGFMGGLDEAVGMENIRVDASGHTVTVGKIAVGFGFGAPAGRIDTHMAMAVDGLGSTDIPPGPMRDYVPTHIAWSPHLSGVPVADFFALIDHAIDGDGKNDDALTAEAIGLLAKGPLNLGIDDISLTMGPASLKGGGQVLMASETDITGKAQFTMIGLDELIKQVNAIPELQQVGAGPILFLLKGMGRAEGDNTVWDVTYIDAKMLVNGTDLSSMMPGGK